MHLQANIDPEPRIANARDHYQRTVQHYLSAQTPREREARGRAMQIALRQTLEQRYSAR